MLTREELDEGIEIALIPASDDDAKFSSEFQSELRQVISRLRESGLRLSPRMFVMDAVGGGGGMTGELTVLAQTLGPVAGTVLGAFLQGRFGRRVKVKIDGIEVEARTTEEVEKLLALAKAHKQDDEPKRIIP